MSSSGRETIPQAEIIKLSALSLGAGFLGVALWEFGVEHIISTDAEFRESFGWEFVEAMFIASTIVTLSMPLWLRTFRKLSAAKAEVAQKESLFSEIFLSIPGLCAISDVKSGRYIEVNEPWLTAFGYQRHEVIGKTPSDLGLWVSPEARRQLLDELKQNGGRVRDYEAQIRSRTGRLIDVLISGEIVVIDGAERMFLVGQDISLLKQAQQQLHDAIDSISDGFVLYDSDMRLVACNQIFKDLYHYTDDEARVGVHAEKLGELDIERGIVRVPEASDYISRRTLSEDGPPEVYSVRLVDGRSIQTRDQRTSDGGVVSIQTDVTAYENLVEELREIHAQLEDRIAERTRDLEEQIAERTAAERRLRDAFTAVQDADQAKTDFLATVSHELRTPLNAIIGFTSIMRTGQFGAIENPRYQEYLGDIQNSGEHLLALINDILDVSAVEAGKLVLSETECLLSGIIADAVRFVTTRAANGNVTLKNRVNESNAPGMRLDERRILQVFVNILGNAVKFTTSGGTVLIESVQTKSGDMEIHVTDTGVGMSDEDVTKALQPFAQIANPLTREHEGTGLGLPLTHALVDLHGGELFIESTPGQGTIVTVRLPACRLI